ncbi:RHS repeat-associated core domain-containing protein [Myroides odoratus]|uniref:RHS repeat-associated core domain-containing protein n=1 Tax=Myroides odoratus TaxID=256 RepID=UPI003342059C
MFKNFKFFATLLLYIISQIIVAQENQVTLAFDTSGYASQQQTFNISSSFETAKDTIAPIKGEASVSSVGGFNFKVPIEVLPGVNGFIPDLSLVYDSNSANGIAGWGWNIAGLSTIAVGSKSMELDNSSRGVQYDGNDPYYLDGERLLTTDGVNFTTFLFSNVKIKKFFPIRDYSFIVHYPDGKIAKFKSFKNDTHMIAEIMDAMGNKINYDYIQENENLYLTKITYGGELKLVVKFNYKNRVFVSKKYFRGKDVLNTKVLESIVVATPGDENKIYKKYLLTHDFIFSNTVERLIQVDILNEEGEYLKPLQFSYTGKADSGKMEVSYERSYNASKIFGIGDVSVADFLGEGKISPIYEVILPGPNGELNPTRSINLWHSRKGKIADYTNENRRLFSGKVLSKKNIGNSVETIISQNDLLIVLKSDYSDNSKDQFTAQFLNVNANSNQMNEGFLKFSLPKIMKENEYKDERYPIYDWYGNIQYYGTRRKYLSKDVEYPYGSLTSEKIRDKVSRKIILEDLNNDGLVDLLIFSPKGVEGSSRVTYHFCEIGKLSRNGQEIELRELSYSQGINFSTELMFYPIDFDGDRLPEYLTVDPQGNLNVLKINFDNFSIQKLDVGITQLPDFSKKTPLIFGDYNGDGLPDFIYPTKVYDLSSSTAKKELDKMNTDRLYWRSYLSTGKKFIEDGIKDLTSQKLAYIAPSQRHDIKRYSFWQKFWSGNQDYYRGTEFGTSSVIAMDVNGDGITDLVSFRKFGKIKYKDDLRQSQFLEDIGFSSPLVENDGIQMFLVKSKTNGGFNVTSTAVGDGNGQLGFSLKNRDISPFSLILPKSDFNILNQYKNGMIIHDPLGSEVHYTIDNDGFVEGQLRTINDGTGSKLNVEYRPLSEDNNNNKEKIYTTDNTLLPFPYFVHKSNGTHYLVHKLNTVYDNKSVTREYRYHNAIQHLQGKGFLGFQKTMTSDVYESKLKDSKYYIVKDFSRGVFWTVNINDPLMDNALISSTFGSLNQTALFSKTTITNRRFNKNGKSYLILPISEKIEDFLHGYEIHKQNTYIDSPAKLLLEQSETNYYSPSLTGSGIQLTSTVIGKFSYGGEFRDLETTAFFTGLVAKKETTSKRGNHVFTTLEEFNYNTKGNVIKSKKYGNGTSPIITDFEYYPFGGIKKETVSTADLTSLVTSYKYDESKRFVVETVTPDGSVSSSEVDIYGNVLVDKDVLGREVTYKYDSWGNAHTVIDYLGNKTRTKKKSSNTAGAKYDIVDLGDDGSESITSYDLFDREIQTRTKSLNNKWVKTQKVYDAYGNVIKSSEPFYEGEAIKWNNTVFDRLNRPVEIIDFKGKVLTLCYEKNKTTVEDGHKEYIKWFDAQGYEIKTQDQGGVILNTYFANGALKEANYDGIVTSVTIDGWGNKTKLVDPSAGTYTYNYDNFSRIKEAINPKGGKTTFTYDNLGRLVKEITRGGSEENTNISIDYTYDMRTNLPLSISGQYNGLAFSYNTIYDQYGRILSKKETTPKFVYSNSFVYDALGRVERSEFKTTLTDSNTTSTATVYNVYDTATGILKMQKDGLNSNAKTIWEVNSVTAFGASNKITYGNGVVEENKYDAKNFLHQIKHTGQKGVILDIRYAYNHTRGTLSSRLNTAFDVFEQYTYDNLDRLLTESLNGTLINEYTYDQRGRITSNTEIGKYDYNATDYRIKKINFNEKGSRLIQDRGFAVVNYNSFKSPTEIYLAEKGRINYDFSILKNRYASYFGSTKAKGEQPIQKYYSADKSIEIIVDKDKTQLITYLTGDPYSANYIKIDEIKAGRIIAYKNYYLHRDNQGTIVGISDETSNIVEERYFDAWGNLKQAKIKGVVVQINELGWNENLLFDRGYTGHEHLFTVGLIHMNGRVYDPKLRRFLSPDNYVQDNSNTQNYNRYGYVLNNPLLYTDPSGEFIPQLITAVAIGIAVAITTNAIINIANGVPFWYGMGKSATMGAISGAVSFGVGAAFAALSPAVSAASTAMNIAEAGATAAGTAATGGAVAGAVAGATASASTSATAVAVTTSIKFVKIVKDVALTAAKGIVSSYTSEIFSSKGDAITLDFSINKARFKKMMINGAVKGAGKGIDYGFAKLTKLVGIKDEINFGMKKMPGISVSKILATPTKSIVSNALNEKVVFKSFNIYSIGGGIIKFNSDRVDFNEAKILDHVDGWGISGVKAGLAWLGVDFESKAKFPKFSLFDVNFKYDNKVTDFLKNKGKTWLGKEVNMPYAIYSGTALLSASSVLQQQGYIKLK